MANTKSTKHTPNKHHTGQRGETAAAAYLQANGYTIVGMNWRCKVGEIDIIARAADGLYVFVEVRTRESIDTAFESVTPHKREKMIRAAYAYADIHPDADENWRIDVIAVVLTLDQPIIQHVQDALDW